MEHLDQHGVRPNNKNIRKPDLIDLIIKEGFNRPPPENKETKDDKQQIETQLTAQIEQQMPR